MTSTSEFVSNENSRRKILEKIREQNVPNSQLFQEFLVEYELLAEYRLLQVSFTLQGAPGGLGDEVSSAN